MEYSVSDILILSFTLIIIYKNIIWWRRRSRLPPGPWRLPFIGNMIQLGMKPYLKVHEWAKIHGDIMTVYFGPDPAVIVSDPKLVREMYNDNVFNGRIDNELTMMQSEGKYGILNSDTQTWEEQRRFILRHLRDFGFGRNYMENLILGEVQDVISWLKTKELEKKSFSIKGMFSIAILNSLWTIISGQRHSQDDPKLHSLLGKITDAFNQIMKTGLLFVPSLRHVIPELSGYRRLERVTEDLKTYLRATVRDHEETLTSDPRDLIDTFLLKINSGDPTESSFIGESGKKNLMANLMDLFNAGSESTSTSLSWIFKYLIVHQDVQARMQDEIDRVVGSLRLPSLSDRAQMPFTEATIYEVLRIATVAPLGGPPHKCMIDKEFHGYLIPKNAMLMPNVYGIHMNPKYWKNPQEFNPERFISPDKKSMIKNQEAFLTFLTGKRACIGEPLAKDTLFLFTTVILQRFCIQPDPFHGKYDLTPDPGLLSPPKDFTITLKDRRE